MQQTIGAVVLAAGASTRLGFPKQLAMVGGERLLERAMRVAIEAGCTPVVVLGASASLIREQCSLCDAVVVVNENWASGMGSSIRCGVEALKGVDGCIVMTCDMPAVTPSHLLALINSGTVIASSYAGRRGVPAYFPASAFRDLTNLRGDVGARELLQAAPAIALPGGQFDVDTAQELMRVCELFD